MVFTLKWIIFVLFLHQHSRAEINHCAPCSCICTFDTYKSYIRIKDLPCVECNGRNLTAVPLFPRNLTETIKTLSLDDNHITALEHGGFKDYTNLETLSLYGNRISTLVPKTFQGLTRLKYLYLGQNIITNVSKGAFDGLGKLKRLLIDRNEIKTLVPNTFQGLTTLEDLQLNSNMISSISKGAFNGLGKLKRLLIDGNRIKTLVPNTFQGLTTLGDLQLNFNMISSISEGAFSGLHKLKDLWVSANEIERLAPNTFRGLIALEFLGLSHNRITNVSKGAFDGLGKLKRLMIDSNEIKTLVPNTFQGLTTLEDLELNSNMISSISKDLFDGLLRLKALNLHGNSVKILVPNTFQGLTTLEDLQLGSNMISSISKDLFDGLLRLKALNLQGNRIKEIQSDAFSSLVSLATLNVAENNVSVIGRRAFAHFGNLIFLSLQNNHLRNIPAALWMPRFTHVTLNIEDNLFHCSCKMLNELKQFQYGTKLLKPTASSFKSKCANSTNVTSLCEEGRNFALGMKVVHNCADMRRATSSSLIDELESEHFVTDEDISSFAICLRNDVDFQVNLPGVIVVTKVVVVFRSCVKDKINVSVTVGDSLSDKYTTCYKRDLILLRSSSITTLSASCIKTPFGRDVRVKISFKDVISNCVKGHEVRVHGYEQKKYNIWGKWNQWETCSKTCGNGYRKRQRVCNNSTSLVCLVPGPEYRRAVTDVDEEYCNRKPCFQAVYQWTIGAVAGVFILTMFGIIFWYRKFKMITYVDGLRPNPNFQMDPDRTLLEQIEELPYDLHWEFPRYDVKFGSVLGEGNFGKVWHATAKGIKAFNPRDKSDLSSRAKLAKLQDQRVHDYFTTVTEAWVLGDCDTTHHYDVAVKTLKECATPQHERDLASELKLLIYMGPHPNIVNVLASCTIRGDLWVILEFCDHGCLKNFLSDRRNHFTHSWSKQSANILADICFFDLLRMCEQITKGVMFLHCWNVVHRDLSARNILVDANFNIKVADFGLARSDGFVAAEDDIMPIKWSAIESLLRQEYSSKSDIWSVGVLFWEIFSLGEVPYPGMKSRDVAQQLKDGYRMIAPDRCPDEIWRMISDCWNADPNLRPSAMELFEQLDELKVAVCSAPDGEYYGTGGEYGQAGTVQGPSLEDILQSGDNFGYEDEASADHTIVDIHKTLSHGDVQVSGPSTIAYEQYQILETEIYDLKEENQHYKAEIQRYKDEIRRLSEEIENVRSNEPLDPHDKERRADIEEYNDLVCDRTESRAGEDIELKEGPASTHDANESIETTDL